MECRRDEGVVGEGEGGGGGLGRGERGSENHYADGVLHPFVFGNVSGGATPERN